MLSIIITTYNVRPFIKVAIDCINNIPFKLKEVIVVDDASNDGTKEEIEALQLQYTDLDIKLITFELNTPGGVCYAGNAGLKAATGDYIAYLDGDDWLRPEPFDRALRRLIKSDADFILTDCEEYIHEEGTYHKYPEHEHWAIIDGDSYMDMRIRFLDRVTAAICLQICKLTPFMPKWVINHLRYRYRTTDRSIKWRDLQKKKKEPEQDNLTHLRAYLMMAPFPWRKIYRASFLRENKILFPEGDWFFEDNVFHWEAGLKANNFIFFRDTVYIHRIWSGQSIGGGGQSEKFLKIFDHADTIWKLVEDSVHVNDLIPVYGEWFNNQVEWCKRMGCNEEKVKILADRSEFKQHTSS